MSKNSDVMVRPRKGLRSDTVVIRDLLLCTGLREAVERVL